MRRKFYGFNNRFRTTKNTEVIVFEKGGVEQKNKKNSKKVVKNS